MECIVVAGGGSWGQEALADGGCKRSAWRAWLDPTASWGQHSTWKAPATVAIYTNCDGTHIPRYHRDHQKQSIMNAEEKDLQINPVVPENVIHNTKTITDIRSLTSSIFGIAAGILGLESYSGFIFYLLGSSIVSVLMVFFLAGGKPQNYFRSASEIWTTEVFSGSSLSSFILTWTLFFGLLRA
ncbi:Rab5-interacting protein-domain-containing protein [Tuber borchii]|uniref:ER membrane protein complex subunit 6 n=1 Tax=Tuber borchii TaxID=42251 RepID=A0A2T6ZZ21_TUBBO|nr:Rab5-interacting protein-domain-containing protein [Tuber borchii]